MPALLIVSNCPSANTQKLQDAVVRGAGSEDFDNINLTVRQPLDCTPEDVLSTNGIILGTTENFGYMSGVVKDFLERIYYPCLEETQGLPAILFVKGGLDGQGAKTSMERIITGLRWNLVQPTLVMKGDFNSEFITQCEEIGTYMAAGLDAGIF